MKTKAAKDRNIISGDFVKKTKLKMKVYSNEAPVIKTDSKLTAKEKGNRDNKNQLKSGKK